MNWWIRIIADDYFTSSRWHMADNQLILHTSWPALSTLLSGGGVTDSTPNTLQMIILLSVIGNKCEC